MSDAARFLQQAQFSSTDTEIGQLRSLGYEGWLAAAMSAPLSRSAWDALMARGANTEALVNSTAPLDPMIWEQLIASSDGLRKRVALAWSEIMVVSILGVDGESPAFAMAAYWDTLNAHAFGNYRALLEAITLNPAMGSYLNTRGNLKEDATGRVPDENYAREVLQLFSVGLYQLNLDGSLALQGGQPVETYKPDTITNLARIFTGYNWDQTGHVRATNPLRYRNPMTVTASRHSALDCTLFGVSIPASLGPAERLKRALDTIFAHDNVGPFIGRQLIQRLVTSNPSPAFVAAVAGIFNNNGQGVRGDLRAVTAAVLLHPEARKAPTGSYPGKVREPIARLTQWARSFGAQSASGAWFGDLSDPATRLGQSPLRSPSVFNFFRPGYVPPSTAMAAAQQVAPEFQLVNETTVAGYLNLMNNVIANSSDMKANYSAEVALADDPPALLERLNRLLAAGQLSAATLSTISTAVATMPKTTPAQLQQRVQSAVLLVMACPEYLVQK